MNDHKTPWKRHGYGKPQEPCDWHELAQIELFGDNPEVTLYWSDVAAIGALADQWMREYGNDD